MASAFIVTGVTHCQESTGHETWPLRTGVRLVNKDSVDDSARSDQAVSYAPQSDVALLLAAIDCEATYLRRGATGAGDGNHGVGMVRGLRAANAAASAVGPTDGSATSSAPQAQTGSIKSASSGVLWGRHSHCRRQRTRATPKHQPATASSERHHQCRRAPSAWQILDPATRPCMTRQNPSPTPWPTTSPSERRWCRPGQPPEQPRRAPTKHPPWISCRRPW
jgi:hypothetical protein